jgi:hypothetical protein
MNNIKNSPPRLFLFLGANIRLTRAGARAESGAEFRDEASAIVEILWIFYVLEF